MSFGIDIRNSVAIGLGGIATLASGGVSGAPPPPQTTWTVINSTSVSYTCSFGVINSAGTTLTCPVTVYNSSGTAITPV